MYMHMRIIETPYETTMAAMPHRVQRRLTSIKEKRSNDVGYTVRHNDERADGNFLSIADCVYSLEAD
jgi:hypothetical protein